MERNRHDLYSGGWAFPAAPFNWTMYMFYGGDLREGELTWLREQVTQVAVMTPADDDGDWPRGFLITDERGTAVTWQVRHGSVTERAAPEMSWPRVKLSMACQYLQRWFP